MKVLEHWESRSWFYLAEVPTPMSEVRYPSHCLFLIGVCAVSSCILSCLHPCPCDIALYSINVLIPFHHRKCRIISQSRLGWSLQTI